MTGSDTLGLVLMKAGYAHAAHDKEAGTAAIGGIMSGIGKVAPFMARLASKSRGLFSGGARALGAAEGAAARGIGAAEGAAARGIGRTLPRPNIPSGWEASALRRQAAGIPRTTDAWAPRVWRGGQSTAQGASAAAPTMQGIGNSVAATARNAATSVSNAASGAFPRIRPWLRGTPLKGNYSWGFRGIGNKLDQWANSGWKGRLATMIPRRLVPGRGTYGTIGLAYGGAQGVNARDAGRRTEEMSTAAAAQAIRQMRDLPFMDRVGSLFAGDDTVANYLRKKQPGVADAFQAQRADPTLFDRQVRDAPYQALIPFFPKTR